MHPVKPVTLYQKKINSKSKVGKSKGYIYFFVAFAVNL